jgi:ketosteroid isomerase-like protein
MRKSAKQPNDLECFFVERVNAGDIEGLVALYEPGATLACGKGEVIVGRSEIRRFFINILANRPHLAPSIQAPALFSGDLALTCSRHSNGDVSAEIARRQPDGNWLWAIDQFAAAFADGIPTSPMVEPFEPPPTPALPRGGL